MVSYFKGREKNVSIGEQRKIFGPKRGERRKLHNVERHKLYRNADIITLKSHRLQWTECVSWMGDGRRAHKLLGKPEGIRLYSRLKIRWEDNLI